MCPVFVDIGYFWELNDMDSYPEMANPNIVVQRHLFQTRAYTEPHVDDVS